MSKWPRGKHLLEVVSSAQSSDKCPKDALAAEPSAVLPSQAALGEEANMVSIPCWQVDDQHDSLLKSLVDSLVRIYSGPPAIGDVRPLSHQVSEALKAHDVATITTGSGSIDHCLC